MRVAVISDVHGNAFALDAVLAELRQASPDLILNLGDQVEGVADPAQAAEVQAELASAGALEVRGNNEEKLWPEGRRSALSRSFGEWLSGQVDAPALARLAALPLTVSALDGELLACHGTPDSAWHSLLWEWQPEGAGPHGQSGRGFYRSRDPRRVLRQLEPLYLGGRGTGVVVCGHTHRPGATRVGNILLVNAGAVSDQVDGDPRARWTLLERRAGAWSVNFCAVPYDVEAAVRWAETHSPFGAFVGGMLRNATFDGRGVGEGR
ncbi:metallophosphoesterase [Deinococcus sp. QL22]|uniref:metallophosphoesterase family protein n=1 Tax=Deinococcus sp. QL22 TaxID=2939437 RepID=UPI0020173589|nr:metallophosphoesterase family protein [Deinococcus sp. QL22]UQN05342.1 metallophosphatase family protein [Deinococcus sp. QL22]